MRHLPRAALSQAALDKLQVLTQEVTSAADPKAKAKARWKSKPKDTFDEVRAALEAMASGHARCMYCEDSLGTDIDHFWPKADFPERAFKWENYLLACSYCNSNLKRNQFPRDAAGQPELLDPTVDEPAKHLFFLPTDGRFLAIGPKGHQSIAVFGLNDNAPPRQLPRARVQAFLRLEALIREYDRVVRTDPARAAELQDAARQHPFSGVLVWLTRIAQGPNAAVVLGAGLLALIQQHGVVGWV